MTPFRLQDNPLLQRIEWREAMCARDARLMASYLRRNTPSDQREAETCLEVMRSQGLEKPGTQACLLVLVQGGARIMVNAAPTLIALNSELRAAMAARGYGVRTVDEFGWTPLHWLAGCLEEVDLELYARQWREMLELGACVEQVCKEGSTALDQLRRNPWAAIRTPVVDRVIGQFNAQRQAGVLEGITPKSPPQVRPPRL